MQLYRIYVLEKAGMCRLPASLTVSNKPVCHLLGSGWSLNESYQLIDRKSSFVVGFNFSFLKCSDPDIHFIENASIADARFFINTLDHYAGLERYQVFDKTNVVFKNISELKNTVRIIKWIYAKKAYYIQDKHYRIFSNKSLRPTLIDMLSQKNCLPQAVSSVIGMILFARQSGYKQIVVHGVDFYGPHYYGLSLKDALYSEAFSHNGVARSELFHATATGKSGVGVQEILVELKAMLEREGIQLLSAVPQSPSAKILGSYYE
ncbi:hypothetical protein STUTZSP0542_33110 [Stutzerimonas marianensis]